jgi:hypothetical protein
MVTDEQTGQLALLQANGASFREVLAAHEEMLNSDAYDDGYEAGYDACYEYERRSAE